MHLRSVLIIAAALLGCRSAPPEAVAADRPSQASVGHAAPGSPPVESPSAAPAPKRGRSSARSPGAVSPAAAGTSGGAAPAAAGLSLRDAIRSALDRNPDLAAFRPREAVASAALDAARRYPHDPKLGVDFRPYTRASAGEHTDALIGVSVLEEVEIAGQGRHRARAGEAELDRTRLELLDREVIVSARTARRYAGALHRRGARESADALVRLWEEALGVMERRFTAGLSPITEVALSRARLTAARRKAALEQIRDEAAVGELRREIGLAPDEPLVLPGRIQDWRWRQPRPTENATLAAGGAPPGPPPSPEGAQRAEPPDLAASRIEGLSGSRPDVRVAEAEARAAEARLDLASASRIPNVTIGPVWERDEAGTSFLGFQTELPIPLFNGGRGERRIRQAEAAAGQTALEELRRKARIEARTAFAHYEEAYGVVERSRGDLEGPLEADLGRIQAQFEAGQVDLSKVHDARATLIEARQDFLDAVLELALAAADLAEAAGMPPESLIIGPEDRP